MLREVVSRLVFAFSLSARESRLAHTAVAGCTVILHSLLLCDADPVHSDSEKAAYLDPSPADSWGRMTVCSEASCTIGCGVGSLVSTRHIPGAPASRS